VRRRVGRIVLIIPVVASVAVGCLTSFVTFPASCATTAVALIDAIPGEVGLWIVCLILWLGSLSLLAVGLWRWIADLPRAVKAWTWVGGLIVLGWGLLASAVPYSVLSTPVNTVMCTTDGLGVFAAFGGGAILLLGLAGALVLALSPALNQDSESSES
jgi:hypothetical protein